MWLIDKILKFRILSILFAVLLTFGIGQFAGKLRQDNSYESFFARGDSSYVKLQQYYETFGNDDFIFLLVDSHGKKDSAFFKRLDVLVHRLDSELKFVDRVTWLGNVESVTSSAGSDVISIAPLFPDMELSDSEIAGIVSRAKNDEAYRDKLISADGDILGIVVNFKDYPTDDTNSVNVFRNQATPHIQEILRDFSDLDVRTVGAPVISYYNDRDIQEEGTVWVEIGLAAMLIMLIISTRSIIGTVIPLLTVILSIILTMGLYQIFGFTLNMLAMMIPILILCVGIGDSVHLVAEYRSLYAGKISKQEALKKTVRLISLPMILTTLTTALGFSSFIFTELVPVRELGIQAAIGAVIALILTFFFAVPLLSFTRIKPREASSENTDAKAGEPAAVNSGDGDIFDRILGIFSRMVLRFPKTVTAVLAVIIVTTFCAMFNLKIETAFIQDLPVDDPLRQDFDFVDSHMGGAMSIELILDTGKENGVKDLSFIRDMDKLQSYINHHPLARETSSFLDQLKQMNRAVHQNDDRYYAVPDNQNSVSELLLLYESAGGREFERNVSFAYDTAHMQIRTVSLTTSDVKSLERDILDYISSQKLNLHAEFTGASCLLTVVADYLAESLFTSFIYAFITIFIVMTLVFRSFKIGLLSMIPNVIPVIVTLGLVSFAGARINMVLVILAPIILGVCIDDTIHFITRFRYYFGVYGCYRKAFVSTVHSVGRVLIFTTLVSGVCLMSFMASKFAGPFTFAWSSVTAFAVALLCDLTVTPLMIMAFKPFGRERTAA